jgi:oligopeptide transport system substrate-binding protein
MSLKCILLREKVLSVVGYFLIFKACEGGSFLSLSNMGKIKFPFIFSVIFIFFISGCRTQHSQKTVPVNYGGVFKFEQTNPVETFDPREILFLNDWQISSLIYEGLAWYNDERDSIEPLLAESWQVSSDGCQWTIRLRNDVHFQDDPCFPSGKGRRLTAADILYTFERLASPQAVCSNWYLFAGKIIGIDDYHSGAAADISGIFIADDLHVQITLPRPYAAFLNLLATSATMIVPREAVEYYGIHFRDHPVGTGPFCLARRDPLQEIVFVKNEHYWRKDSDNRPLPYLDGLHLRFKSSAMVALSDFLKGENDLLEGDSRLGLQSGENDSQPFKVGAKHIDYSVRFFGFMLDGDSPVVRNVELRRAIAMSYNKEKLAQNLPELEFVPAGSLVPPVLLHTKMEFYPYDKEKAKALFDKYLSTLENPTCTIASNLKTPEIGVLVPELSRYGIKVLFRHVPVDYYHTIITEHPDIFRVSYQPSFPDPEEYYSLFYSKSSRDINLTGYSNGEYDHLLDQARMELDAKKRQDLFVRLERILARDVPAIYTNHNSPHYYYVNQSVEGFKVRLSIPDYRTVWFNHHVKVQSEN